jgi:hypothetical protein
MKSFFSVLLLVVFVAGCKNTTIQNNGTDRAERNVAMQNCVGQFDIRNAPEAIRLACT